MIEWRKKLVGWRKKKAIELEACTEVNDIEPADDCFEEEEPVDIPKPANLAESLLLGEFNDLLINDLYSQERGVRVEIFGVQLDEMWSFVQKKENKAWIWLALNPANRQIIGMHVGNRSKEDAQKLWENIPKFFREQVGFFSDYWKAYQAVFDPETHFAVGKDSGLTAYIERFNCTLRQRASRLVRKALSFSKSMDNHIGAIKYFICSYNRELSALKI